MTAIDSPFTADPLPWARQQRAGRPLDQLVMLTLAVAYPAGFPSTAPVYLVLADRCCTTPKKARHAVYRLLRSGHVRVQGPGMLELSVRA